MFVYGWFMLTFDRKQQNSVKQLSFNKKSKLFFKSVLHICYFQVLKIKESLQSHMPQLLILKLQFPRDMEEPSFSLLLISSSPPWESSKSRVSYLRSLSWSGNRGRRATFRVKHKWNRERQGRKSRTMKGWAWRKFLLKWNWKVNRISLMAIGW